MRDLLNLLKILTALMLVPIIPFLFLGGTFEGWLAAWQAAPPPPSATAGIVIGLLATDILLPVPSSVVSTLAGSQLGAFGGTMAACAGMTIGAVVGFAVARRWGRPVALWFSTENELERLQRLTATYGPLVLVLFRAVPVLAEASVLLVGIHSLPWRRFLPPVLLSNLGIAWAYAQFGQYASQHEWLAWALAVSVALPLALAATVRWWLARHETTPPSRP